MLLEKNLDTFSFGFQQDNAITDNLHRFESQVEHDKNVLQSKKGQTHFSLSFQQNSTITNNLHRFETRVKHEKKSLSITKMIGY